MQRPNLSTLFVFIFVVIIGGSNAVAVRFSNLELPPFWGAAMRFSAAAVIFWLIVLTFKIKIPQGKGLIGAMAFGALAVGFSYAFLYWGLLRVPAGMTMVVMAIAPLLTFFFAIFHRIEKFRWRGLGGALIALAGIIIGVGGGLEGNVPVLSLLAVAAGAACLAEGNVIYKLIPKNHPLSMNAVAVSTGAVLLIALSLASGEEWFLPGAGNALLAVSYLVVIGTVLLFYLYLYVLSRWTASATSYSFLLFPISTIIIAAWLAGEAITISFVFGGLLVMLGVWLGAVSRPKPAPRVKDVRAASATRTRDLDPAD
jgi:drug/metabolite transporter (DMT)-like permease